MAEKSQFLAQLNDNNGRQSRISYLKYHNNEKNIRRTWYLCCHALKACAKFSQFGKNFQYNGIHSK